MAEDKGPQTNADKTDLNLTAIIKALDTEKSLSVVHDSSEQPAFDPNATMNYQQAGAPFPEFPFANEEANSHARPQPREENAAPTHKPIRYRPDEIPSNRSRNMSDKAPSNRAVERTSAAVPRTPRTSTRNPASSPRNPVRTATRGSAATQTREARSPVSTSSFDNHTSNYRPINTKQSAYKIRGGGSPQKFNLRSPVFVVASALLVVIGIVIFVFGVTGLTSSVSGGSTDTVFNLTTTQTREAIDSRLPVLVNYIDASIEDTSAAIAASGQYTYSNGSYQADSPDLGAVGSEMVSMPQEMSEELMAGYYEGSYSAYSPEELAQYFNGTYVLDMTRGELGAWDKIKYVNLNATSIEDEMTHLAALQGLSGDTVTISAQGVDSRGNKVIQGQKVVEGDKVLYFKIAACPFSDIYNSAQTISDASVYVTCTLANYDFYTGSDEITPE